MDPNSIEDIILARVLPVVQRQVEDRLTDIRREMARKFLYTIVNTQELADIIDMSPDSVRRKRSLGELPYSLNRGNYVFDLKEIYLKAHECNFYNPFRVREAIEAWMDRAVGEKMEEEKV